MQSRFITGRVTQIFRFTQKARYIETYPRDFSALSFRIKGESHFFGKEEERWIGEGTVLLVPAGISYARQCVEDEEIIVFHFSSLETIGGEIMSYSGENAEDYRALFERALEIWNQKETGYYYATTAIFYEILSRLAQDSTGKYQNGSSHADAAAQMMQKDFANSALTVKEIAGRLFISEVYLRRVFHAAYGVSPKQYLDALRMEYAKTLLDSGYYTHREIAKLCGYVDVKYFRTAFKSHTGITPTTYAKFGVKEMKM